MINFISARRIKVAFMAAVFAFTQVMLPAQVALANTVQVNPNNDPNKP